MAIPDYQTLMLPFLKAVSNGQPHSMSSLFDRLSNEFNLTADERQERLPSGKDTYIKNRIGWARTYLKKAGLLISPDKGVIQITESGQDVLKNNPDHINNRFLRQFESFVEFRPRSGDKEKEIMTIIEESDISTPEEKFDSAYYEFREQLESELLDTITQSSPKYFEQIVVDMMLAIGYGGAIKGSGETTQISNDDGFDGIINEDKLGLDTIFLQAKRWDNNTVHRPEIDKFIGAITRKGGRKGVFITTSKFSSGAVEAASGLSISIVLIDGKQLAQYMIEHDVGVFVAHTYKLKTIDSDYFNED